MISQIGFISLFLGLSFSLLIFLFSLLFSITFKTFKLTTPSLDFIPSFLIVSEALLYLGIIPSNFTILSIGTNGS